MGNPDVAFWLDMMSDTVAINAFVRHSVSGASTYDMANTKEYPAYIQIKNHLIVDKQGREILARGRVFLGSADVPSVEDLITLPAEYVPRTPPILAINVANDESGNHHTVLEIG